MKLDKLAVDGGCGGKGCPAVYLDEDGQFVVQGLVLDNATTGELHNLAAGETAVRISADVVIAAIKRYESKATS